MTQLIKKPTDQKKESGFILIATIVIVTLLGFLGVTASYLFTSGTTTTKDYLLSTRAFYVAEGGLERGIRQYLGNSGYSGETSSLALGGQTYPFIISVFTNDFSGNNLPANQLRIRSSCTFQNAQRIVDQIVQRQSVLSQYEVSSTGTPSIGASPNWTCSNPPCPCSNPPCPPYRGDNQSIPTITVSGGANFTDPPLAGGNTYNYNNVTVSNHTTLNITGSGAVTIYCKSLSVGNHCNINTSGTASRLLIIVEGNVTIDTQSNYCGAIYAGGNISIGSQFTLTGAIAGNSVSIGAQSTLNFDPQAGVNAVAGYSQTGATVSRVANGWREAF